VFARLAAEQLVQGRTERLALDVPVSGEPSWPMPVMPASVSTRTTMWLGED